MKTKLFLIISLLFCFNAIFATSTDEKSRIEINSSAEQEVNPDQIFLQIELNSKINTDKNALQKIKIIAEKAGIDTKKNFKTTEIENSIEEIWFGADKVNTVEKIKITASSTKQVYQIFEKMKSIKASKITISGFDYSKKEELKRKLLSKATKKAKEKAELLASSLGQKVGKAIFICDESNWMQSSRYSPYRNEKNRYRTLMTGEARVRGGIGSEENSDVPEFEKLKFVARVFVIFELN